MIDKKEPKNLFKTVKVLDISFQVLDFDVITKLDYTCNFILSERGKTGKSYNAKEYILTQYLKHKKLSGWILNTDRQWEETYREFLKYNLKHSTRWDKVIVSSLGMFLDGVRFCRFFSMTGAGRAKSNRLVLDYLFYDEMNECCDRVKPTQVHSLFSIAFTSSDVIFNKYPQIFIFCNQKSMGMPILEKFGIIEITSPFMVEEDYVMMYVPDVEDRKNIQTTLQKKMDEKFLKLCKLGGVYETDVLNKNTIDNIWGITPFTKLNLNKFKPEGTIYKTKKRYYSIYTYKNTWYFRNIDRPKTGDKVVVCRKNLIENNITFNQNLWPIIFRKIINNKINYDGVVTKDDIFKSIL